MGESVELRDYLGVIGMEWINLAQTLVTIFIVGEYIGIQGRSSRQ